MEKSEFKATWMKHCGIKPHEHLYTELGYRHTGEYFAEIAWGYWIEEGKEDGYFPEVDMWDAPPDDYPGATDCEVFGSMGHHDA